MVHKKEYEISSGNVFADLARDNAEEQLAKADIAREINRLITAQKLTQAAAARLLGIDQPKISALKTGKLSGFSLERLFRFLTILGYDITIKVGPPREHEQPQVAVKFVKMRRSPVQQRESIQASLSARSARKK
jgi:predicted XRE-type DNA-binding protein